MAKSYLNAFSCMQTLTITLMIDNLPTCVNVANLGPWCRVPGVDPAAHRGASGYDVCAGQYPQVLGWRRLDTFLNISSQCLSSECVSSESVSSECLSSEMHCVCVSSEQSVVHVRVSCELHHEMKISIAT